jgi:GAF domain-containing protein
LGGQEMLEASGKSLTEAAAAITRGEPSLIANLANISALIWMYTERINWAGFYLLDGETLVLGPFQGKPACVRIPLGKGVCGTAAQRRETVVVDDVDAFPGHIACDGASRSELVVPIFKDGSLLGVLDIDSPELSRFGEAERETFEGLAKIISTL